MHYKNDLLAEFDYKASASPVVWELNISVEKVKKWIESPKLNAGLMFRTADDRKVTKSGLITMSSGDANWTASTVPNAIFLPKLTIEYAAVPEPASLALFGLG